MGQYHLLVNLDRREFVDPHKIGCGLKLWEQLANNPSTGAALIALCAVSNGRGGGDLSIPDSGFSLNGEPCDLIGRWGGQRIAFVGDYGEPGDLPPEDKADLIYDLCQLAQSTGSAQRKKREQYAAHAREMADRARKNGGTYGDRTVEEWSAKAESVLVDTVFTDISEPVRQMFEHELGGWFVGEGWCTFVQAEDIRSQVTTLKGRENADSHGIAMEVNRRWGNCLGDDRVKAEVERACGEDIWNAVQSVRAALGAGI